MKQLLVLWCFALFSICAYAQNITVKGVVTSGSDGEPLIGATIQVKGS